MDQKKRSSSVRGHLSKLLGIEKDPNYSNISKAPRQIQEMKEEADKNFFFDSLKNLNKSQPPETRLASIQEVCNFLRAYRIEDSQILRMCWRTIEDMFESTQPIELQKGGFAVLCALLEAHYENIEPLLRREMFLTVAQSPLDHIGKFHALLLLTDFGRELPPFEKDIGDLLLSWLTTSKYTVPLLNVTLDIVKYNCALFDELSVIALLKKICSLCDETSDVEIIERCLKFCEILTKKGKIPITTLHTLISTLCQTVNIEKFCLLSWSLMKEILSGETRGYQSIRVLCQILDDPNNRTKVTLLRGAVFFVSMSLWGFQRISTLNVSPSLVLPSFLKVLLCGHPIVAYEVLLAIHRLIKKYGPELRVEWGVLFNIIFNLKPYTFTSQDQENSIASLLLQLLETIEEQYRNKQFFGDEKLLFHTLENFVSLRDEAAAFFVLDRKTEEIIPANSRWLSSLQKMMTLFFVGEKRTPIRAKAFAILKNVFVTYKFLYGPEIAEKAVIPYLSSVHLDPDPQIRIVGIELLVYVAENIYSNQFFTIVDLLHNFIVSGNVDIEVKRKATAALLNLFRVKFPLKRFTQTLYIYERLLPLVSDSDTFIRHEVLSCLLQLRSTDKYQMQLGDVTCLYLRCQPGNRPNVGYFAIAPLFDALMGRVKKETHLQIFTTVIRGLQQFLINKWILFQVDVSGLVSVVCRLLESRIFGMAHDSMPISDNQKMENFQLGYELLTLLVGYVHEELTPTEHLEEIVNCFCSALAYKWNCPLEAKLLLLRTCLNGLCLCNAEIPSGVVNYIPKIIGTLHQISLTHPEMAMSILEYFNSLVTYPTLIKRSLSQSDFKIIFTTILQHINITIYPPIVATFAYQVLAPWLLQCNIKERPQFFNLIKNSLLTQIQQNKCLLAEANLDLLSRYTFTDCEAISSSEDNEEESYLFEGGKTQIWAQGNTLISIKTGKVGWAKVILRRATGKFVWLMQLQNKLRSIGERETRANYLKDYMNQFRQFIVNSVNEDVISEIVNETSSSQNLRHSQSNSKPNMPKKFAAESAENEENSKAMEQEKRCQDKDQQVSVLTSSPIQGDNSLIPPLSVLAPSQVRSESYEQNFQTSLSSLPLNLNANSVIAHSKSDSLFEDDFSLHQNTNLSSSWTSHGLQSTFSPPESFVTSFDLPQCTNISTNVSLSNFSRLPSYEGEDDSSGKKTSARRKAIDHQDDKITSRSGHISEVSISPLQITTVPRLSNIQVELPALDQTVISSSSKENSKLVTHLLEPRHTSSLLSLESVHPQTSDIESSGSPLLSKSLSLTSLKSLIENSKICQPSDVRHSQSTSLSFLSSPANSDDITTTQQSISPVTENIEENLTAKHFTKLVTLKSASAVAFLRRILKKDKIQSRESTGDLSSASSALSSLFITQHDNNSNITQYASQFQRTSLAPETLKADRDNSSSSLTEGHNQTEGESTSQQSQESPSIHPSFVFLQLQQIPFMDAKPKQLKMGEALERALSVLDKTLTVETHKIGVLFIDEGQTKQEEILSNTHGSPRYLKFLRNLGKTIQLKNLKIGEYTGGLDRHSVDQDGEFALRWNDDVTQVMFHVITFMPNIPSDPHFTNKKRHIGNDYVHIVWSESNQPYDPETITSQFTFVSLVIYPLEPKFYRVDIRRRVEIPPFGPIAKTQIVSERSLHSLVRQTAIHANLASKLYLLQQKKIQYVSNCEDRLRQIKTVAERFAQENE